MHFIQYCETPAEVEAMRTFPGSCTSSYVSLHEHCTLLAARPISSAITLHIYKDFRQHVAVLPNQGKALYAPTGAKLEKTGEGQEVLEYALELMARSAKGFVQKFIAYHLIEKQ